MASNRTIKKPTRSEFLLKGISARYQNYSLERIKDLYKDDDLFKNEKDLTAEQKERYDEIGVLLTSYGSVMRDSLQYNYGVKIDTKAEVNKKLTDKQKGILGRVKLAAKKATVALFETSQKAIQGFNYNYCGSGTPIVEYLLNGKPPSTRLDYLCMIHDITYLNIGSRGLNKQELNKEVRRADDILKDDAMELMKELKNKGLEGSRLYDDATVVISAMKAKKGIEDFKGISPSSFIEETKQAEVGKVREALIQNSGRSLVSELNTENVEELLKKLQDDKILTGSDLSEFKRTAEALLQLDIVEETPTYLISRENRRKDSSFTAKVMNEQKFLDNAFGSDNQDIDEFAKAKPLTLMGEERNFYFGQPDPLFDVDPELEGPERLVKEVTGTTAEEDAGLAEAGEERKDDPEAPPPRVEPGEEGETLIDPSDPVKETPVDVADVIGQRDNVGKEERADLNADPPMSAMAMTDAKPVVGERNMRPTLFREEGDTVKLSNRQEQENRLFYENFTWIDAGFGNGNIQRIPGQVYAGKDIANNRLYTAQVKNDVLKYSGNLFVGNQQYRKKYNISANTRNLVRRPMFSTVQHHQEFVRDSSLPAGAGRKHQMARDNPSWIPSKNVNSRVGHLFYPDVVDGQRL